MAGRNGPQCADYLSELNRSMDGVFAMLDKLNEYPSCRRTTSWS
jgi:hypothetical protein